MKQTTFEDSFHLSNDVLNHGVQSITDLMVKPGIINLDFADVETVMSSMGKAMMGTGEAEGENRALTATDMALNNPLIDDYSLKGAKGLLVNITGGKDITLFEVDQAVNKIRAEVDPEAELIFGAIKDEDLNGKMRVSIVATALDGQTANTNGVVNMVNRIQNRNTGYSEGLFQNGTVTQSNSYGVTNGATALKLDERFETRENSEILISPQEEVIKNEETDKDIASGVSIESASYIENNNINSEVSEMTENINISESEENMTTTTTENLEEYTPKLFSDEVESESSETTRDSSAILDEDNSSLAQEEDQNLFEQTHPHRIDLEIPAFLRRQKV